jgi:hypothetical protein
VTKGIPLEASLVRGSHGLPVRAPRHRTALICSAPDGLRSGGAYRDVDVKGIVMDRLTA